MLSNKNRNFKSQKSENEEEKSKNPKKVSVKKHIALRSASIDISKKALEKGWETRRSMVKH
jgi:hypothetical protein